MMRSIFLTALIVLSSLTARLNAQLSGTYNVPTNFTTIAAAIASLNTAGVSGPVTIQVTSGHTETATAGGYSLNAIVGTSSTNVVIFQKTGGGANPLITAYTGTATPASATQDGVWRLIGADYITIDGIDITDPNTSNPGTMEFGYGLFKANTGDGCQYNTIKNCVITLNRINNVAGSGPSIEGSKGISMINATSDANITAITTTAAAGANSNNKFYSNTIQNCNIGICLIGFADVTPFTFADSNNDIGGSSSATGNIILNFGGGGTVASAGISTLAQYNINVSYNTINSNNGTGVNHAGILRGIYLNTAVSAAATIVSNTVTVKAAGTTQVVNAIDNASGATAASNTITISNNLITNCSYTTATTGGFSGILSSASANALIVSNNTFSNNVVKSTSGFYYSINNTGAITGNINILNNTFSSIAYHPTSGVLRGISNTAGASTATVTISNNTLQPVTSTVTGTGIHSFIYNSATTAQNEISLNAASNVTLFTSGTTYLIYNSNSTPFNLINGNYISGTFSKSAGGTFYCYYNFGSPSGGTATISGNNFSNITLSGATTFYGIYVGTSTTQIEIISGNIISNVTAGTSAMYGIYHSYGAAGSAVSNNTITGLYGGGIIYGIGHGNVASPQLNINNNTINTFSTTGATVVYGIYQLGGTASKVYQNKIYNLSGNNAGTYVSGIYVNAGTSTIYNNLVGELNAGAATSTMAVTGMHINGGTNIGVYYNSVHLNASSTGTTFGTAALYYSGVPALELKNNIFMNISGSAGTGSAIAFCMGTSTLANLSLNSNNNSYYAGTPGANNLIFYDGTNSYQTLAAYQAAVFPREVNSITEITPFLSVSGSGANFLHLNTTSPSLTESGAVNIPGITIDYDTQIRYGNSGYAGTGTAPDIGADEFDQLLPVCAGAVSSTISALTLTACAGQSISIYASGYSTGSGITHQWKVSTAQGGPYSNVTGGSNPNHFAYSTASQPAGTFYYVMVTTCSVGPVSATSNEISFTIQPSPSASITASSVVCAGVTFSLTGSTDVGTTYAWSGPNGFTSTSQNTLIAGVTTAATGNYSLVTTFNQCSSPATIHSLTVNQVTVSVTGNNSDLCYGNSATLTASSNAANFLWSNAATTSSIVISPTVNTVYTVTATDAYSCSAQATASLSVTNPTIAGISSGVCVNTTGTLSVNVFTPSIVQWYATSTSTTSIGSGLNYTLNAPSTTTVYAQATGVKSGSLFTTLAGGNSASGNMFNILPLANIVVNGVAMHFATAAVTTTVEVWYRVGSFVGFETSNTGWTLAHSTTVVTSGTGTLTPIPGTFAISVPSGSTYALYVTSTNGSPSTNYTNGSTLGALYAANSDLQFYEGKGGGYFSVTNSPRIFNGVIYYSKPGCVSPLEPVVLTVNPNPVLTAVANPTGICSGSTATLSVSGANTYTWSLNGLNTATVAASPSLTTTYSVSGTNTVTGCSATSTVALDVTPMPTLSIIASNSAVCAGSPVTMTASGASSFTWNTSANTTTITGSPLLNTVYTVSNQTLPCAVVSASISILANPLPTVSIAASPTAICIGDSSSLTASGANTYSWDTGSSNTVIVVSPIINTDYTVTGTDALGCVNASTLSVQVNPLPTIGISPASATVCAGSPVTFTANGGTGYSWNTGPTTATLTVNPVASTNYTVTGTDLNGCSSDATVAVSTNSLPVITVAKSSNTLCLTSSVSFTASGANSYSWSSGGGTATTTVQPASVGNTTYSVTGIATNSCSTTQTVAVTTMSLPSISLSPASATVCIDDVTTLTVSGAASYTLMPGNVNAATFTISPAANTVYTVTGTDVNTCVNNATANITVDACTGISESASLSSMINLFPNPTTGFINAEFGFEGNKEIFISNSIGGVVQHSSTTDASQTFDLSQMAKGIYFITVKSGINTANFKVIVQ